MFGAEPQEQWTKEEAKEFESHASARLKSCIRSALWASAELAVVILCIVPFSAGHSLNAHWGSAKYLTYVAMALWLWCVLKWSFVWSSRQSSRETRREFGEPR